MFILTLFKNSFEMIEQVNKIELKLNFQKIISILCGNREKSVLFTA